MNLLVQTMKLWGPGTDWDSEAGCGCVVGLIHRAVVDQRGMETTSWVKDSPRSIGTVRSISPKGDGIESRTESGAQGVYLQSGKTGLRSESGDRS